MIERALMILVPVAAYVLVHRLTVRIIKPDDAGDRIVCWIVAAGLLALLAIVGFLASNALWWVLTGHAWMENR